MNNNFLDKIQNDEEKANIRKVKEYIVPLLMNLGHKNLKELKLLSVGCGWGTDVEYLVEFEVNAYGIEPFSRTKAWSIRNNKGRLLIADGRNLPFKKDSFDVILCLEVIEHVGWEEEKETTPDKIIIDRERFARELSRVLKPGGIIILSTPNRHCPVDIGHGSNFLGLRIHSPLKDFTLSLKEIKMLFIKPSYCSAFAHLPYKNFAAWDAWKKYSIVMAFLPFIKLFLIVLDKFSFLKSSFLSPRLILLIKK